MAKKVEPKSNPIPGSVAAAMQRGLPQRKAMASVGIETQEPKPVKTGY